MRNELSKARFWKRIRLSGIIVSVILAEIALLIGGLNILSDVNYQVTQYYLNIPLIAIVVITLVMLFNCVLFVLARKMKVDVFDLYADSSVDQIEFNIHELIQLRNNIAKHQGTENKLMLTIIKQDDRKVIPLVTERAE